MDEHNWAFGRQLFLLQIFRTLSFPVFRVFVVLASVLGASQLCVRLPALCVSLHLSPCNLIINTRWGNIHAERLWHKNMVAASASQARRRKTKWVLQLRILFFIAVPSLYLFLYSSNVTSSATSNRHQLLCKWFVDCLLVTGRNNWGFNCDPLLSSPQIPKPGSCCPLSRPTHSSTRTRNSIRMISVQWIRRYSCSWTHQAGQ